MNLPQIARKTIEAKFTGIPFSLDEVIKEKYKEELACFVTIKKGEELRGCIGSLEPTQPLWKDIQQNSIHAAFHDPRFFPLTKEELPEISIEISILSLPTTLEFSSENDLLTKLNHKMGIVLKKDTNSATFLPQVWEEIPDKVEFLEKLSQKAGLAKDSWKDSEILYYHVKVEKD